jgi:hypothetical protein
MSVAVPTLIQRGTWEAGAVFSECERFRYRLWRRWDASVPPLVFVMLNPSTADENKLDPTVRRCHKRARNSGAGGLEVLNLFAYRATDPDDLRRAGFVAGPHNVEAMREVFATQRGRPIICGWGSNARGLAMPGIALKLMREAGAIPHAIKLTRDGIPAHPLYLADDLEIFALPY